MNDMEVSAPAAKRLRAQKSYSFVGSSWNLLFRLGSVPFFQRNTGGVCDDLIRLIASHFNLADLPSFARTSKDFCRIAREGSCFKSLALSLFPNIDELFATLPRGALLPYIDKLKWLNANMRQPKIEPVVLTRAQKVEMMMKSLESDFTFLLRLSKTSSYVDDEDDSEDEEEGGGTTREHFRRELISQGVWSFGQPLDRHIQLSFPLQEKDLENALWTPMEELLWDVDESIVPSVDEIIAKQSFAEERKRRQTFTFGRNHSFLSTCGEGTELSVFLVEKKSGRTAILLESEFKQTSKLEGENAVDIFKTTSSFGGMVWCDCDDCENGPGLQVKVSRSLFIKPDNEGIPLLMEKFTEVEVGFKFIDDEETTDLTLDQLLELIKRMLFSSN